MSRDRFLGLADRLRSMAGATTLAGTAGFDMRPNTVTRRVRTWASGEVGTPSGNPLVPDYEDDDLLLTPTPRVRAITQREVAGSGGRYEEADLVVGPVTPAYAGPPAGGYTVEQLDPAVTSDAVEVIYVLVGPNAGEHRLVELRRERPLRYEPIIRRTRRTA